MTFEDAEVYEKIYIQMHTTHEELSILSKKSPDGGINKFKLKLVNQLLEKANSILSKDERPFDGFEIFNEDDIPTNSDIVFIISQYIKSLDKFKSENVERINGSCYWVLDDDTDENRYRTSYPVYKK